LLRRSWRCRPAIAILCRYWRLFPPHDEKNRADEVEHQNAGAKQQTNLKTQGSRPQSLVSNFEFGT
jgi:hypothetical protein